MRLALISDVHSNLHALEAVLAEVQRSSPHAVCFLGDAVGYNAFPSQCVQLIRKACVVAVLGNHDQAVLRGGEEWFNDAARAGVEYSRKHLEMSETTYLAGLPLQHNYANVHLVHGSPRAPTTEYVFPDMHPEALDEIVRHQSVGDADVVAMGHTHHPFQRRLGGRLVLNAGSVGQPRDGDSRAAWALVETDEPSAEILRVEYDIDAAARAVRQAGLPDSLAARLYEGL